jgi:hypothetical protein
MFCQNKFDRFTSINISIFVKSVQTIEGVTEKVDKFLTPGACTIKLFTAVSVAVW